MRRLVGVSIVVVCLGVGAARADTLAAPAPEQQKRADELFQEGRKLLVDGNDPAGACAKFDEAIRLDPTADGIMLNLGLCNEKLFKYKTALYWFRKAQFRATETNLPDNERVARQHTTDLATKVATVKIVIAGNVASSKVRIDGDAIKPDDYGHAEVDPGHHVLEAGAQGMKNVRQEFDIKGQGGDTLTVEFVAGDNTIVVDKGKPRKRAALYTAIGGGVLWVASVVVAYEEKSRWSRVSGLADMQSKGTAPGHDAIDTANDAKRVAQIYGTGLFIAGAVAITAAGYLYFTAPSREVIDQTVWVPTVSPDGAGLAAVGRF